MEEIKIGDYIRTKEGYIGKVRQIGGLENELVYFNIRNHRQLCRKISEVKHNKNIIELLDVGDFVNGYKVVEIDEYKPIGDVLQKYLKVDCSRLLNAIYSEQIKTILTKQQYEANCYKVEV